MPLTLSVSDIKRGITPHIKYLEKADEGFIFVANRAAKNKHLMLVKPDHYKNLLKSAGKTSDLETVESLEKDADNVVSFRSKHLNE